MQILQNEPEFSTEATPAPCLICYEMNQGLLTTLRKEAPKLGGLQGGPLGTGQLQVA